MGAQAGLLAPCPCPAPVSPVGCCWALAAPVDSAPRQKHSVLRLRPAQGSGPSRWAQKGSRPFSVMQEMLNGGRSRGAGGTGHSSVTSHGNGAGWAPRDPSCHRALPGGTAAGRSEAGHTHRRHLSGRLAPPSAWRLSAGLQLWEPLCRESKADGIYGRVLVWVNRLLRRTELRRGTWSLSECLDEVNTC